MTVPSPGNCSSRPPKNCRCTWWRRDSAATDRVRPVAVTRRITAGLLVGDAVGVGYEFRAPEKIPSRDQIEMTTPVEFRRSHAGVPVGTWSDDGAQALCLLASLLQRGKLSLTDFAGKLLKWLDDGYMAVGGDVFDVGIQTAQALIKLLQGSQSCADALEGQRVGIKGCSGPAPLSMRRKRARRFRGLPAASRRLSHRGFALGARRSKPSPNVSTRGLGSSPACGARLRASADS
ncbi:hypothetical protein LMG28138_03821 [Pararobbsia alpina]|uniref:ADP-ribosylglycohydrolase n=1 Tax=Pararobbsia alpina TaxID=621374 RepID=A0A6S7BCV0_9BURK|nr:hypothetical protein LMG28138_03821 [Pararobbsia alpina]